MQSSASLLVEIRSLGNLLLCLAHCDQVVLNENY
jgi:hypothetical protein